MKYIVPFLLALAPASPIVAHPHIFIDTGLEMVFDPQGQLTHVRVTWQYDEFYSLLVTEDMGLDADFDGVLTEAENTKLTGFDMQWVEGYNGDLEIMSGTQVLALSGPTQTSAEFAQGRITTTHLRSILSPAATSEPIVIKPYDPTYYTAYDVTRPLVITGSDICRARVKMPDINAGLQALRDQLNTLGVDTYPEDVGLPNIGAQLASDVIVTCSVS
ncbi:MAG: DUF1007 family protein [Sulfitobacter sp.]